MHVCIKRFRVHMRSGKNHLEECHSKLMYIFDVAASNYAFQNLVFTFGRRQIATVHNPQVSSLAPFTMSSTCDADSLLIERIRRGESDAWNELIERYEGRLLAFVESRLGRRGPSEDIVQESFLGFLNSLPNYDGRRPLESYLFSICAYKLTDHLRREGR